MRMRHGVAAISFLTLLAACGDRSPHTAAAPPTSTSASATTTSPATTGAASTVDAPVIGDELDEAATRWAETGSVDYRLRVSEQRNVWTQGCTWSSEVAAGVVIDTHVDEAPTSGITCPPASWTVESLHAEIASMLAQVQQYADPEFGRHTLDVEYGENGMPRYVEFDLANGNDEESLLTITITPRISPIVTAPPADAIEEALITGSLSVDRGCVYLDQPGNGRSAVVFKHGTTWASDTESVVNEDGTSIEIGQPFSASGGGHRVGGLDGIVDGDAAARAESCAEAAGTDRIVVIGYLSPG